MSAPNAKNLRALLIAVYLLLTAVFILLMLFAGNHFKQQHDAMLRTAAERNAMLRKTKDLVLNARRVAGQFALDRSRKNGDSTLRAALALQDQAKIMSEQVYGRSPEYRTAVHDLRYHADHAIPAHHTIGGSMTEEKVLHLFEQYSGALTGMEEALRRMEMLEHDETRIMAQDFRRAYWYMFLFFFGFFLLSFLYLSLGAAWLARTTRRSLQSLSRGTRELRTGNLDFRFQEISPDEIGQIEYDFNIMARRLSMQAGKLQTANRELQEQAEKLIAAHQHKDRFLSNMSHELRTPLNSIIGFSELLEGRAARLTPEKVQSYAKRILTAAEHLLDLIVSLLDLAKSGAGVLKPVFTSFDLASAIRETAGVLAPLAAKKALAVHLDLPETLMVRADARMIKQIFINLYGNAVKYTEQGSITVTLRQEGDSAVLDVTDTGIGIPESEHQHLFTDFYRVDNGPGFVVDGIGIGLALCRRLADLHNGSISFRSKQGEGSTFTFTFPCQ